MRTLALLVLLAFTQRPGTSFAAIQNVTGNGFVYSTQALWGPGGWDPGMLIDGDRGIAIHLDALPGPGAEYSVDLSATYSIQSLKLYPRQDGCCPERFSNVRVALHQDLEGGLGDEVWGVDLFTDGSNAGSGPGVVVELTPPAPVEARWVRIASLTDEPVDYALQLSDLEVLAVVPESEVNQAIGTLATANQPLYQNANPALLVNGNRGRQVVHGQEIIEPGFAYSINLGSPVDLTRIVIWARQDNFNPERLSNYRVSVHPDASGQPGPAVWAADRFTDGSNPGSWVGAKDVLTAELDADGEFLGQWIRIESLEDPVSPYALQITEVEAFGVRQGGPALLITSQPADATAVIGATATFSVAATVVNADPAGITYQWHRGDQPILGATNSTYTLGPITLADDGAAFHCVVSHLDIVTSQVSSNAVLRVNLAFGAPVTSNRPTYVGWEVARLVNGDRNDVLHGDVQIDPGFAYELSLGADVEIERIDIFPRQDGCCPERLQNFRVSVHNDEDGEIGEEVWGTDLFTDGTNPGAFAGSIVSVTADLDPSGTFRGKWIRILDLSDPVPDYSLQMAEIEVYGSYLSLEPVIEITSQPSDYSSVPGHTATFSVAARVINGDASQLTYQWTRNGTPIPGATQPTYRTPPLENSDEGAVYRCIVSYPNATPLESDPATIGFDGNYAKGQPVTSNRPMWGNLQIASLVNGIRTDFVHGDTQIAPGFAYEIDLGADVDVERIDIYPRQDGCCGERFTNVRIQLLADDNGQPGEQTWHADLFTDGSNPGSGAGIVVTLTEGDGTGTFSGGWLRILSMDDPVGDYALQIAEVEVYGQGVPRMPLTISIRHATGGLEAVWSEGTLERSTALSGPWEPIPAATSPYLIQPTQAQEYFRIRRD